MAQINDLRSRAISAGLASPYIVVLNQDTNNASTFASAIGGDAISAYVTARSGGGSYSSLANTERSLWNAHLATGKKVIPWVTTGWDPRPRIDHPVSWTTYPSNHWMQHATAPQIREQLRAAVDWVAANPHAAEAATVLMYAWNEYDEGGWVAPSLGGDTQRIGALSDVMRYSASSTWNESQTPRFAFDGSSGTNWQAAAGSSFAGQWLEVDFGVDSNFNQVILSEYGTRTGYFRIQYLTGDYWHEAFSGQGIGSSRTITFPTVRGTRARVYFDSGIYTPIIYEFQVNNTPAAPNPNLAGNKAYYASSTWGTGQDSWLAFDGNLGTNWQAAQGSNFYQQWLEVRFGQLTTFNSVNISEYGDRTGSFQIEYYANGWKVAYSGYGIGSNANVSFPPVTGIGARIRFLSGSDTPIIYEFGVYFS